MPGKVVTHTKEYRSACQQMAAQIEDDIKAGKIHVMNPNKDEIRKWAEKSVKHKLEQQK